MSPVMWEVSPGCDESTHWKIRSRMLSRATGDILPGDSLVIFLSGGHDL